VERSRVGAALADDGATATLAASGQR